MFNAASISLNLYKRIEQTPEVLDRSVAQIVTQGVTPLANRKVSYEHGYAPGGVANQVKMAKLVPADNLQRLSFLSITKLYSFGIGTIN